MSHVRRYLVPVAGTVYKRKKPGGNRQRMFIAHLLVERVYYSGKMYIQLIPVIRDPEREGWKTHGHTVVGWERALNGRMSTMSIPTWERTIECHVEGPWGKYV